MMEQSEAIELGMNMILLLPEKDKDCRKKIETDLIKKYKPILNKQGT